MRKAYCDTSMGLVSVETTSPDGIPLIDFEECLKERKWWCFLLSSIFTFILGLLSVVLVRVIQHFMCQKVATVELCIWCFSICLDHGF